jgi:hypothetical protein
MTIVERLAGGERPVLDRGTGSELQRRGVDVLHQVTAQQKAWSAMANLSRPEVVVPVARRSELDSNSQPPMTAEVQIREGQVFTGPLFAEPMHLDAPLETW